MKDALFSDVVRVYQVFKDFFGEEYVDLQHLPDDWAIKDLFSDTLTDDGYNVSSATMSRKKSQMEDSYPQIMVWWPTVTVTNEYDVSVNIYDLYAKIPINYFGIMVGNFTMNRATYPQEQFESGYCHSHLPRIYSDFATFHNPCLGRGPINNTIATLRTNNNSLAWLLFCQELSMYVTVESIQGVPYIRMEEIGHNKGYEERNEFSVGCGNDTLGAFTYCLDEATVRDFLVFYLKRKSMKFTYFNGSFSLGMSYIEFRLDLSNAFIEYFNKHIADKDKKDRLWNNSCLCALFYKNNKLYKESNTRTDYSTLNGRPICTFKGKQVTLNILKDEDENKARPLTMLSHPVCNWFFYNILRVINYRYKNNGNNRENNGEATASPSYEKVRYL